MANTERLVVIKMVREAKIIAQNTRYDTSLPVDLRIKIEELFVELDRLEDDLILGAIEEKVSALEKTSKRLADVSAEVKKENEKLQALSAKIEKAAKGLAVLIDIAAKAAVLV